MNIEKRQSAAMLFSLLLCLEESLKADDAPAVETALSVFYQNLRNTVDRARKALE